MLRLLSARYLRAAEAGHAPAWRNLAAMHAFGHGGATKCEATARRLLRYAERLEAAEQADRAAAAALVGEEGEG